MNFRIKKATSDNLPELRSMLGQLYAKEQHDYDTLLNIDWPFSKEGDDYFEKMLSDPRAYVILACREQQTVGYLIGKISDTGGSWRHLQEQAELENMWVLPEFRNQGAGSMLVTEFLSFVRASGVKNVKVMSFAKNQSALKFYQKHGFAPLDVTLETNLT